MTVSCFLGVFVVDLISLLSLRIKFINLCVRVQEVFNKISGRFACGRERPMVLGFLASRSQSSGEKFTRGAE